MLADDLGCTRKRQDLAGFRLGGFLVPSLSFGESGVPIFTPCALAGLECPVSKILLPSLSLGE